MLGISVDSVYCHKEFAEQRQVPFPLLSDFNKEVAGKYGVLMDLGPWKGVARRSVFIIGKDGTVRYAWHSDQPSNLPDVDQVMEEVRQTAG